MNRSDELHQIVNTPSRAEPDSLHDQEPFPLWKRSLDVGTIVVFLPVILVLAGLVALWIKTMSRGELLFRQERIGHDGKPYTILKFRSMSEGVATKPHESHFAKLVEAGHPMTKLDSIGDPRLIPGGAFLRNSGLDELPELINVLRGEMTLVGPRPCLPNEFKHFDAAQRERFSVRPGLTGYWQVNGKNRTTFDEMVALDVHYVRNRSVWLDCGVLAKTPVILCSQLVETVGNRLAAGDEPPKVQKNPKRSFGAR